MVQPFGHGDRRAGRRRTDVKTGDSRAPALRSRRSHLRQGRRDRTTLEPAGVLAGDGSVSSIGAKPLVPARVRDGFASSATSLRDT